MTNTYKMWKYINEGNAHIVLEVRNSLNVIRLIKQSCNNIDNALIVNCVNFVNLVMIPLIFRDHCYNQKVIQISAQDLIELSKNIDDVRPKYRKIKSKISQFATQAPNLTILNLNSNNYCLEIKPKEGFIAANLKPTSKCYYCLKQLMKHKEKQIKSISNYCPLELYSGDIDRMKHAIVNLLQNPQNNIKLFKDGSIVYNEKSSLKDFENIIKSMNIFTSVNLFLDFIVNILINRSCMSSIKETNEVIIEKDKASECDETSVLSPKSFLHDLKYLQMLSDKLQFKLENTDSDFDYVPKVLQHLESHNYNLDQDDNRKEFLDTLKTEELALISAIAKDCSIMISFSLECEPIDKNNYGHVIINGKTITYRFAVTDLEPKSLKTLNKRKETVNKLLQMYQNSQVTAI